MSSSSGHDQPWPVRHAALLAVLAVLLLTTCVRLRVATVPLERDEGEYAYAGQLILHGIPPYSLAQNMKFPGTYYAYAATMALFGQSPWGIRMGLLLVNAATTLLLFFLGRRLLSSTPAAAVGAAAFALLSVDRWILGTFAHATHFALLPAVAGLLVLTRALDTRRAAAFLGAGILLGTAVLMKQHAATYVVLGCGVLVWHDRRTARAPGDTARRLLMLAAGALLPLALICLLFAAQGVLGRFWFWTFQYAREYVSARPLSAAWPVLSREWASMTRASGAIWLVAAAGLAALRLVRWPAEARVWLAGLTVAGVLAVCPGFYFRSHYFVLLLPAASLLVGVAIVSAERLLAVAVPRPAARALALGLALLAAGRYVVPEQRYLFSMSMRDLSREIYQTNPFVEAPEIARYIREHSSPTDRIAVFGSEPEIYFHAGRRAATSYLYTYPLFESQPFARRMAEEMIGEIEASRPSYVVYAVIRSSWTERELPDARVVQWARAYTRDCYDVVGVADIDTAQTTLVWDAPARTYQPTSANVVYTLRRRADGPCASAR